MESAVNALPRRLRALGWAGLFPVVMLVCFVYWGMRPWTWTVVVAALAIALLIPAVAADLLAVALIGFALYWFALFQRTSTLPPGSPTTVGYPFHSVVFGHGPPHVIDLTAGVVMLADPSRGTGLRGVERRLGTSDGVLAVSSPPGGPTIVVIEVPCAS
jgi:hypothetical protein